MQVFPFRLLSRLHFLSFALLCVLCLPYLFNSSSIPSLFPWPSRYQQVLVELLRPLPRLQHGTAFWEQLDAGRHLKGQYRTIHLDLRIREIQTSRQNGKRQHTPDVHGDGCRICDFWWTFDHLRSGYEGRDRIWAIGSQKRRKIDGAV